MFTQEKLNFICSFLKTNIQSIRIPGLKNKIMNNLMKVLIVCHSNTTAHVYNIKQLNLLSIKHLNIKLAEK